MVAAARRGMALRQVARRFGVALATVRLWVARAEGSRLDRVDFAAKPPGRPRPVNRSSQELEDLVLTLRVELKDRSDLGEFGARAIRDALKAKGLSPLPSARTVGRILERRGALDGRKRTRRPPPPAGWYLPDVAARRAELDQIDIVEGLVIRGGPQVEVLNAVSLHGGLAASCPVESPVTSQLTVQSLLEHWREVGLPGYAQFDNDMIFHGTHRYPDALGRVLRVCLSLAVVPVLVPPREAGFQAMIESYNGWWQAKVWSRSQHQDVEDLRGHSRRYVAASRRQRAARTEAAPDRRAFPADWELDLKKRPKGRLAYLRRSDPQGAVALLGQ